MKYEDERLEKTLLKLQNLEEVTNQNYEAIEEFYTRVYSRDKIGNQRIYKYLTTWKSLFQTDPEYSSENIISKDLNLREATKDDYRKVNVRIKKSDYSEWTKTDFKTTIKKFYKVLYPDELERPKRIKKIIRADFLKRKPNIQNKKETKALTASEIKQMSLEASNSRDRLLPIFLFETGARISEVMGQEAKDYECEGIKLKHVELKEKYADVDVPTLKNKHKGKKKLQLVRSVGLLREWLEEHPRGNDPEAPLFCNIAREHKGQSVSKERISDILVELSERADIDKPIRNHVFRHSSATYKGTELGWNTNRLMYWHGWSDPDMAKKYQHEDEDRMKAQRLEEEGLQSSETSRDKALDIEECPRCSESVDPFSSYCPNCSLALDQRIAADLENTKDPVKDELIDELKQEIGISDSELEEMIREKVQQQQQRDTE